jgi:hypothetical protein
MAATLQPIESGDEQLADLICERREHAGRHFGEGDFVALLGGDVVAVGKPFDEVRRALAAVEADPLRGLIFRVEQPAEDVIR